ncbi:membrane protein [Intrasporangium oryzae NRRL B-24470]|uniref:Membrane protein n=1 Tax=Intrasporangium oryzae NRRL B-24470 TaxID=1386089 RepID=W9G5I0_9MICO|nr:M50 family metallopeptidase [Intrasporangium oryzae]EWT01290.1 membrane protein [Intrasporangium oryzae NRRL B-24470]
MDWYQQIRERVIPATGEVAVNAPLLVWVLLIAVVALWLPPVWAVVRLAVTLVHELGHAVVGVLVGRKFTGFVLRGDMSGQAVTRGRPTGPGRVASTWAGYPAPAVVGGAMVFLAARGWAAPVITVVIAILLFALVRVRSALTAVVMAVALGGSVALWWWRDDVVQLHVLIGVGIVLVVGAWRHLAAVRRDRTGGSDPAVLASLTHVPRLVWNLSFALVCALATWVVGVQLLAVRR